MLSFGHETSAGNLHLSFLVGHAIAQNSQNGLSGIWKGYIKSTERKIPYELVISSNDGVFSGYSYTTFGVKSNIVTMKKYCLI